MTLCSLARRTTIADTVSPGHLPLFGPGLCLESRDLRPVLLRLRLCATRAAPRPGARDRSERRGDQEDAAAINERYGRYEYDALARMYITVFSGGIVPGPVYYSDSSAGHRSRWRWIGCDIILSGDHQTAMRLPRTVSLSRNRSPTRNQRRHGLRDSAGRTTWSTGV